MKENSFQPNDYDTQKIMFREILHMSSFKSVEFNLLRQMREAFFPKKNKIVSLFLLFPILIDQILVRLVYMLFV